MKKLAFSVAAAGALLMAPAALADDDDDDDATPQGGGPVPEAVSTLAILGLAVGGLAGARMLLKK